MFRRSYLIHGVQSSLRSEFPHIPCPFTVALWRQSPLLPCLFDCSHGAKWVLGIPLHAHWVVHHTKEISGDVQKHFGVHAEDVELTPRIPSSLAEEPLSNTWASPGDFDYLLGLNHDHVERLVSARRAAKWIFRMALWQRLIGLQYRLEIPLADGGTGSVRTSRPPRRAFLRDLTQADVVHSTGSQPLADFLTTDELHLLGYFFDAAEPLVRARRNAWRNRFQKAVSEALVKCPPGPS